MSPSVAERTNGSKTEETAALHNTLKNTVGYGRSQQDMRSLHPKLMQ